MTRTGGSQRTEPDLGQTSVKEIEHHLTVPPGSIRVIVRQRWLTLEVCGTPLAELRRHLIEKRRKADAASSRRPRRMIPCSPRLIKEQPVTAVRRASGARLTRCLFPKSIGRWRPGLKG